MRVGPVDGGLHVLRLGAEPLSPPELWRLPVGPRHADPQHDRDGLQPRGVGRPTVLARQDHPPGVRPEPVQGQHHLPGGGHAHLLV